MSMSEQPNIVGWRVQLLEHLAFGDHWVENFEAWGCKRKWVIGNNLLKVFLDEKNICRV